MELSKKTQAEFQRLKRNLTALIDFSRSINSSLDLDFTLNNLLLSCMGKFLTTKGFVALFDDGFLRIVKEKGLGDDARDFPRLTSLDDHDAVQSLEAYCASRMMIYEPITSSRGMLGCISLGQKINREPLSEEESNFLKTMLNIAATAIENAEMINNLKFLNRNLDSRINRLDSLFELSKEFGLLIDDDRIGKLLLYAILGNFLISNYVILYFLDNKLKILQSTIPKTILLEELQIDSLKRINAPLGAAQIKSLFPDDPRFGFELAVPLVTRTETKGLLLLGKRADGSKYEAEDIDFINSISSLAIVSLENRRLFKEALEKQKMEEELEIAKSIQRNLLPRAIPDLSDIDIDATTLPSKFVSGDYYDIIHLPNGELCFAIADVSGKGVPASLLMANMQAFLKSICKQSLPISQATGLLNDLISENTSDGSFITFFWMYLDTRTKVLKYVNAGHNPPLLLRNGTIRYLDKGGMIFGVIKTIAPYDVEEVQLASGDVLVLFTDGVTEAKNQADEEYSDARLEALIRNTADERSGRIIQTITDDVREFAHGADQSDDITIMVLTIT